MKGFARTTAIHALALTLVSQILPGLELSGGIATIVFSAVLLTIMYSIIKPVLNIILLPLHIITLGSFSFLVHVVILYFLTVFVPNVTVSPFVFRGASLAGFVIPKADFNSFFAFVVVAVTYSFLVSLIQWLIK